MKYIKTYERLSKKDKFVDVIFKYYGPDGIFSKYFKKELTRDIIENYLDGFIAKRTEHFFNGDDVDRELFRDYLFVKLGYRKLEDCENKNAIRKLFTQEELNDSEIMYKTRKFNI